MKRHKVKIMGMAIAAGTVIVLLFLFTPLFFGRLPLDGEYRVRIRVNDRELVALMENNSSSQAFKRMISRRPKTVRMGDYGSMEKVGMLGRALPKNDKETQTEPGDIILFMGGSIVVYYDTNSWNFTKLGHIENTSPEELKKILGRGNVRMTFELME